MEKLRGGSSAQTFKDLPASVGALSFAAGARLPESGSSVHDQDEISFILSGVLRAESGGERFTLRAGDVTLIPAGEAHWAEVVEDVTLCYVLLEPR